MNSECVAGESMSVSQRTTQNGAIAYYARGRDKGETSVNLLEQILSNQNME